MKKGNIEFNYEKLLEERVDELTTTLAESLTRELDLQEELKTKYYYVIGVTTAVSGQLINLEVIHHLFTTPLLACKRLKAGWGPLRKDFKDRFEARGFEFKYYTIDSFNVYHDLSIKEKIRPVREKSWSFETRKEVEITIKTLKE
jgi:hypothetical protein